ncbi:MAG: helix-turn-helix transcriptional regulator [Dinoroseobacter sp.]|nr:helix-turn-helix transcriptional regulator [Dinoroseobacter sp.]MDJ0992233.1 helix-turn-helix transcriptional regulator [Dinoroseobacter sp.]
MDADVNWYSDDVATFGDRLATAREAAGLSQSQLARRLGVKLATLRGWENDVAEPRANRVQMLAGMLNVSLGWLLTGDASEGGVPEPGTGSDASDQVSAWLQDLRMLRAELARINTDMALLEKRLRSALETKE